MKVEQKLDERIEKELAPNGVFAGLLITRDDISSDIGSALVNFCTKGSMNIGEGTLFSAIGRMKEVSTVPTRCLYGWEDYPPVSYKPVMEYLFPSELETLASFLDHLVTQHKKLHKRCLEKACNEKCGKPRSLPNRKKSSSNAFVNYLMSFNKPLLDPTEKSKRPSLNDAERDQYKSLLKEYGVNTDLMEELRKLLRRTKAGNALGYCDGTKQFEPS